MEERKQVGFKIVEMIGESIIDPNVVNSLKETVEPKELEKIQLTIDKFDLLQKCVQQHPLTCGRNSNHNLLKLKPNEDSWQLYCPDCEYVQNYIPSFIFDKENIVCKYCYNVKFCNEELNRINPIEHVPAIPIRIETMAINSFPKECNWVITITNPYDKEEYGEYLKEQDIRMNEHPAYEFDLADQYYSDHGKTVDESLLKKSSSWTCVDILHDLRGKPWNNLALNYVLAFKPRMIRVTKDSMTLDYQQNRVTVYVENDNRTIRNIEMELIVPIFGCLNGSDLDKKLYSQETKQND
jgi:hypothetical protein